MSEGTRFGEQMVKSRHLLDVGLWCPIKKAELVQL